jgi:hypothetical protein
MNHLAASSGVSRVNVTLVPDLVRDDGSAIVKNPRPEDMALFGAPWKGAKGLSSAPGIVGVME